MKSGDMQTIGQTLLEIVTPDMSPKQLLKAVKKAHPNATKKDIVLGAFYTLIANVDADPQKSKQLQAFAISQRGTDFAGEV